MEQCKYLGTTVSIKNSDFDLKREMKKMHANANLLLRKFSKCSVNVKCLRLTALIYIVHPCGLIVQNSVNKIESNLQQQFETIYGLAMAQQCQ